MLKTTVAFVFFGEGWDEYYTRREHISMGERGFPHAM